MENKLSTDNLNYHCDPSLFDFDTTADIEEKPSIIGQERLSASLDFGVDIPKEGFNIFALGPNETNKLDYIKNYLREKANSEDVPSDICYVNNFDDKYKPETLLIPAGRGKELRSQMNQLIEELLPTLQSAFESEEYQNKKQALQDSIQDEQDHTFEELQKKAREKGLALIRTPSGFTFAPIKDGDLMDQNEIQNLPEEERERLQNETKKLQKELQKIIRQMPSNKRMYREQQKDLDREIAEYAIKELFTKIRENFSNLDEVLEFLDNVQNDIVENVQQIMSPQGKQNPMMQMMGGGGGQKMQDTGDASNNPVLERYKVNVLVDHSDTEGAPIVYENNPNHKNLTGRVEYQSKMGALTTNFNLIKPGALHKANGGYLILDARRVLLEPFAWENLKRSLKSCEIKIESIGESYSFISTVSLEPEPIDLNIKVVLLGERLLYYLLCEFDPDFQTLFKVEADFEDEINKSDQNNKLYASLLAGLIEKYELLQFDKNAIARMIEHSARMAGDREKLSAKTDDISDYLVEASHWAENNGHDIVNAEDVEKAIKQKIYRSARMRDKVQEAINRDMIFIDTEGESVGQINGLSVTGIGNLIFGRPNRITASVQLGKGEIIDIEREVDMSGPIHSKGVLILKGFLGERYALNAPLSISASIVFEQSYSNIDGDSASSAELYALLSAIGKIPIKQNFAVTGSVNQHGKIQPIGGVNEKIEGFFDICNKRGLTGEHAVLIPRANEKNLILKNEVIDAVNEEKFHIYSVENVDEGMELLTGKKMGEPDAEGNYPEDTVNYYVTRQLQNFAENRKTFVTKQNGNQA